MSQSAGEINDRVLDSHIVGNRPTATDAGATFLFAMKGGFLYSPMQAAQSTWQPHGASLSGNLPG
jgi:hypothetical protein